MRSYIGRVSKVDPPHQCKIGLKAYIIHIMISRFDISCILSYRLRLKNV